MKHLKEFKLNEVAGSKNSNKNFEIIKNMIIGDLIEDYEFTDKFLSKQEVEEYLERYTWKMSKHYDDIYHELTKFLNMMKSDINIRKQYSNVQN